METLNFDITFLPFSSNYLVHLDPEVFSALPSLKHLDLAHNFLMSLPQPFFQVPTIAMDYMFRFFAKLSQHLSFQAVTTASSLQLVYLQVSIKQVSLTSALSQGNP